MSILIVDLCFAALVSLLGAGGGWWLRGAFGGRNQNNAAIVLARLHALTAHVAEDVGKHTTAVRRINSQLGEPTTKVSDMVAELMAANETMQEQLAQAEERLRRQAQELETTLQDARTDVLTGLANRRAYDDEIQRRAAEFERHARPVSLLLVDIDHFKKFNDNHGHRAGDEVLRGVALVLRKTMRDMDFVARYGGEEFSIVFPGTKLQDARIGALRACKAVEAAQFSFEGKQFKVTVSIGLAEMISGESVQHTIERADQALYRSKEAGRNCAHMHDGHVILRVDRDAPKPEAPAVVLAPPAEAAPVTAKPREDSVAPTIDPETGLANREFFCQEVGRRISDWKRGGAAPTTALMKIDGFADLVKSAGSPKVELALRKLLGQLVRPMLGDMDHSTRYGDDAIAILFPNLRARQAAELCDRIRRAIAAYDVKGLRDRPLTVSFGVADVTKGDNSEILLHRTQEAVEKAASRGDRCFWCNAGRIESFSGEGSA